MLLIINKLNKENASEEEDDEKDDGDDEENNRKRQLSDRKDHKAAFLQSLLGNLSPRKLDKNSTRLPQLMPAVRFAGVSSANCDGDEIRASLSAEVQYDAIYAGTRDTEAAASFTSDTRSKNAVQHTPLNNQANYHHLKQQQLSAPQSSQSNISGSALRAMQIGRNKSPASTNSGRGRGGGVGLR